MEPHGAAATVVDTFVEGFHSADTFLSAHHFRPLGKTGMRTPPLSIGGSTFGSLYGDVDETEATAVLHALLKRGLNLIDTAPWYGQGKSEKLLGKLLCGVPRQAFYLNTKVGRYEPEVSKMFDFSRQKTLQSVEESLSLLQVDYVDVIQVHDLEFAPSLDIIINETLPALQQIKESGKARFIGITGYPLNVLRQVVEKNAEVNPHIKIDTILTYSRFTLHDATLLDHLDYFRERGIGVINAAPLSMGLLSHSGPPAWHPATDALKRTSREAADYCHTKGVKISKLALYFAITNPEVTTTLVGTVRHAEMEENMGVLLNSLSPLEMECLKVLQERFFRPMGNVHWENIEVANYHKKIKGA